MSTPAIGNSTAVRPVVAKRKPTVHRKPVVRHSVAAPQRQARPKKPHRKAASPARAAALPPTICGKPVALPATAVGAYSETIALTPQQPVLPAPAVETAAGPATGDLVPPTQPAVGSMPTDPAATPPALQPGWPTGVPGVLPTAPYVLLPFAPVPGVPEPSTGWMALAGLAVVVAYAARRPRNAHKAG